MKHKGCCAFVFHVNFAVKNDISQLMPDTHAYPRLHFDDGYAVALL
jgi:hypothetical protein